MALAKELYITGRESCPNDDQAGWLSRSDPALYDTKF